MDGAILTVDVSIEKPHGKRQHEAWTRVTGTIANLFISSHGPEPIFRIARKGYEETAIIFRNADSNSPFFRSEALRSGNGSGSAESGGAVVLSSWSSFCLLREELAATSVYWNYLLPSTCDEDLNAPFSRRTSCVMDHCVFVVSWTLEDLKSNFPNST